jgi:hypothetical protein
MKIVKRETAEAVFQFALEDVVDVLKSHASEEESKELMDFVSIQAEDVIEIPQGKKSFMFAILDLLASDKGHVFCKACGREYPANELVSFPIGVGENPLKVKVGYRESLLNRILGRQKRVPLFGARGISVQKGMS